MIPSEILRADVVVVGGGMSAAWAAIGAARQGASVIVVDRGSMGTSGVTATGGPGHWWVPPDPAARAAAVERQAEKARGLGDPAWMARIIELTWKHLPEIAPWYPFGTDGNGGRYIQGVRGPEYMRALRQMVRASGVTILDHHPAVELLTTKDGAVGGIRGVDLRGERSFELQAGAIILATGGCAFRSGLIGSHTQTGDGYLMAAEAGASLSGMEFSISYSLSPAWASTRTLPFFAARFFDRTGTELDIPPPDTGHAHLQALGRAMLAGPVMADLADAPPALEPVLRRIQPLTVAAFARRGVDLFRQRFAVTLFGEGTIRGTGGIRIVGDDCSTEIDGLYAVGDAASRELVAGASSGGGAVNSAWALSSGLIAGEAAAQRTKSKPLRHRLHGAGRTCLHPRRNPASVDLQALNRVIADHMHGYDRALWRTQASLVDSLELLDGVWSELAEHAQGDGRALVKLRETAAMAATARWCTVAALGRAETRGIAVRADAPLERSEFAHRLLASGLDRVQVTPDPDSFARKAKAVA